MALHAFSYFCGQAVSVAIFGAALEHLGQFPALALCAVLIFGLGLGDLGAAGAPAGASGGHLTVGASAACPWMVGNGTAAFRSAELKSGLPIEGGHRQLCGRPLEQYSLLHVALRMIQMRGVHIFALMALGCFVGYSTPSYACRMILSGAGSKSNEANFAYFEHVAVLLAVNIELSHLVSVTDRDAREYVKLRVIKSYKGDLPQEFFVEKSSSAACGQDFREGSKFLAFFDSAKTALKLTVDQSFPVLHTSLVDFSASRMIQIDNLSAADEIIQRAGQR